MKKSARNPGWNLRTSLREEGSAPVFADWKADPQLKTAYDEAQLWADTRINQWRSGAFIFNECSTAVVLDVTSQTRLEHWLSDGVFSLQ